MSTSADSVKPRVKVTNVSPTVVYVVLTIILAIAAFGSSYLLAQ